MELRVLRYFLMVAREENITRAAQLLHVSQPTLSRQLMQLEKELGVTLFRRSQHNIILTDDGMLLKRRAQELVELAEKTERELSRHKEILSGEIAIGCGETCNMAHLSDLMVSFRRQNPNIQYRVYSATADEIKDRIENGLLDFGLLIEPVDIRKYEFVRMPYREHWGILTHKDSPLAQKATVRPADLLHTPLFLAERESVRGSLASWFGPDFEKLNIAATFNLIMNAAIMVKHHLGAALCLDLGTHYYEELRFVPLEPRLESGAVLAWKKNQSSTRAITAFISHIRNSF